MRGARLSIAKLKTRRSATRLRTALLARKVCGSLQKLNFMHAIIVVDRGPRKSLQLRPILLLTSAVNMAGDTRQPDEDENPLQEQLDARRTARKPKPKHEFPQTQASKMWDALGQDPNNPVNEMPGGQYNSAGGKPKEVTWHDAFNYERLNPKMPWFFESSCGRDSLLTGIGASGAVGGLHFILRGTCVYSSINQNSDRFRCFRIDDDVQSCCGHIRPHGYQHALLVRSEEEGGSQGHGSGCRWHEEAE